MLLELVRHLHLNPARLLKQGLPATALQQRATLAGAYPGGLIYRLASGGHIVEIDEGEARKLKDGPPLVYLPASSAEEESPTSIAARALQRLEEIRQAA